MTLTFSEIMCRGLIGKCAYSKDCMTIYAVHALLIICGEEVSRFLQITLQPQKFFGKFLHVNTVKACKAGNHETFWE